MTALGNNGVVQVIPPAQLEQQLQAAAQAKTAAQQPAAQQDFSGLAQYIRSQYEIFRNHRNTSAGWSERMLHALRTFNGQYDATKLQEIRKFGGSEVYARLAAQKCRAASSLLRDVYLGGDRPYAVKPPADPDVPPEITQSIEMALQAEQELVAQHTGQPPAPQEAGDRRRALAEAARQAAKKKASEQARISEDKIEEMLREGGFYHALAEFIVDLPIFPFACLKGPEVRVMPKVTWNPEGGQPKIEMTPHLVWRRVSPFDIWFTPGVSDIRNADVIEKLRITRAELNDMLDLPGYNVEAVRAVLDEYGRGGLYDSWDSTDSERAVLESRENPAWNRSAMLSTMEFNGHVQGRLLQDYGLAVPDELRDYHVQCWVIGSHVVKAQITPSPRMRHPYFITSFEKVPGTPVGNSLIDLISDLQESANATLRSLINNIAISSGPQVVINDDRISPEENSEELYPWKRWHTRNDPLASNAQVPVSFFMPANNAGPLLEVYTKLTEISDDVSAIPKYVGGGSAGGAGRTASGLAMLMGNASKILQTVSANIDRDVMEEALLQLSDLILLTDDTGLLTGEENVSVQGVNVAVQRETTRQRQIEFLQATNNPTDMGIMGMKGRAAALRPVAQTIGLDGEQIVPDDEKLEAMDRAQQQKAADGPIDAMIQEAVAKGVAAGVQRITTEITAGRLAMQEQMPPGAPTHLGTVPGQPTTSDQNMDLGERAAQSQGNQPSPITNKDTGPRTNAVGKPAGPGAPPVAGGPG